MRQFLNRVVRAYFPSTFLIDQRYQTPNQITQIQRSHRTINKSSTESQKIQTCCPTFRLVNILHKVPPSHKEQTRHLRVTRTAPENGVYLKTWHDDSLQPTYPLFLLSIIPLSVIFDGRGTRNEF